MMMGVMEETIYKLMNICSEVKFLMKLVLYIKLKVMITDFHVLLKSNAEIAISNKFIVKKLYIFI